MIKNLVFLLIKVVIMNTIAISNKAAPTILDIVVTKISGLVNNIPPKIKNMMELKFFKDRFVVVEYHAIER